MDPNFVERHWDALPNLRKLRQEGAFGRLATTTPPQSPVAWSTFITGLPPEEHGIYDFVHRDAATLAPSSSLSQNNEPRFHLPLGPFDLPLSLPRITSLRKGTPFWQQLAKRGIPATIIRMPGNYPPEHSGEALAGMGVPDLTGTLGTFTFFTDDPAEYSHAVIGGRIEKVSLVNGRANLPLAGPLNPLRKDRAVVSTNVVFDVDPTRSVGRLSVNHMLSVVQEGEWSGWQQAEFALVPHLASVKGMFRVYVKQLHPRLALYVTPVNADPLSPDLPLSYPQKFSGQLARQTGRFFTLGIAEDTAALRQQVFTHAEFRTQADLVFDDERRLLTECLKRFDRGLLFYYISSIDQNSHILWGRYDAELLSVYQAVDRSIAQIRQTIPDADLIVLSDHGFAKFERAVHLNTWLLHRGFLSTNQAEEKEGTLQQAQWDTTEAYAIGLNGLYLNMKGREKHGSIEPGVAREALLTKLEQQLTSWRDPENGRQIVEVVSRNVVPPRNAAIAPDLIVGYGPGYRASWQTALGGVPEAELENNSDAWIGDHCMNPAAVPGVLFLSGPQAKMPARLQDMTEFVLHKFDARRNN